MTDDAPPAWSGPLLWAMIGVVSTLSAVGIYAYWVAITMPGACP